MSGAGQGPKSNKKPKIVQFGTDANGSIRMILYSDGRLFIWNWTKLPDIYNKTNPYGEGYWGEIQYPKLIP